LTVNLSDTPEGGNKKFVSTFVKSKPYIESITVKKTDREVSRITSTGCGHLEDPVVVILIALAASFNSSIPLSATQPNHHKR